MKIAFFPCALAALLCSTVSSQSSGDQLLAFVRSSSPATPNFVVSQDMDGGCKAPVKIANTLNGSAGLLNLGGGAAYDPTNHSVWVSDGAKIRNLDMAGKTLCEFTPTLTAPKWAVTGLAFNRAKRQLIQLELGSDPSGTRMNVRLYDATKCPPAALPLACKGRTMTGTSVNSAGIAYDGARDLIYYNESISGFFGWDNILHVAKLSAPCTDINTGSPMKVTNCVKGFGPPVTGMGYSECGQKLYVTLGDQTRVLQMTVPSLGMFTDLTTKNNGGRCCTHQLTKNDNYQGLAVMPGFESVVVGKSCLGSGCQSCSPMSLGLVGSPVMGNPEFAIVVNGAPAGSIGSFYLSAGACSSGLSLPGICGPIYPAVSGPMPLLIGSFALTGSGCSGTVSIKTGVPIDTALCGFTMCTQWLVVCPNGSGAGLTNAMQFRVDG